MQYIFRTYAERFAPIFPFDIFKKTCRKFLRDKWNLNRTLSKNFGWKYIAENQTLRDRSSLRDNGKPKTNFACKGCLFIKFRKYKTAFNSGLKIWLVSEKSEMAQFFYLKFCVYL